MSDDEVLRDLRMPTLVDLDELRVTAFVEPEDDPFDFASPVGDGDDG